MAEWAPDEALLKRIEEQLEESGLQVDLEWSEGSLNLNGVVPTQEGREAAEDIVRAVAPEAPIDNQIDVETVLPTDIDRFAGDEPSAELVETRAEIRRLREELDPDFTDQPGLFDPIAAPGGESSNEEDLAKEGETYTPPVDPVLGTNAHGDAEVLGGFGEDEGEEVEASASDNQPGDEALADAIRRELAEDASTTDLNIVVAVRNGVAHLRGRVTDLDDADNAEAVAARVPGVRDVVEELEVASV